MNKLYQIIYADPPWKFKNKNTGGSMISGAVNHYPVMSLAQICKLPVNSIADDNCVLFLWWVSSMPLEALQVVQAWGFKLKTMTGLVWIKKTAKNKPWFGMGFWTRQGVENCLIAVKGKPKKVSASIRCVSDACVLGHSEKPNIFRQKIEYLMGDLPRIELFARSKVDGWDAWGNEVANDVDLVSPN